MARGKKTGGRTAGQRNKRTLELEKRQKEAASKIAKALGSAAFEGDSHALLMAIYKDERHPIELRLDAAKAAIRFEKPALSSVDATVKEPRRYVARLPLKECDPATWVQKYASKIDGNR